MNLNEVIKNRRSIRKYKKKDVSNKIIEELINYARLAPSAKNRQPWEFIIVKNKIKNEIVNMMLAQDKKTRISSGQKIYNSNNSVKATALIIKEAPILILVFRPKDKNWIIGDSLSIGAAIEHICLKATDLKLGSLWVRDIVYVQDSIANLVGKNDMELISAILIGYANENPKQKNKKTLEEVMKWY